MCDIRIGTSGYDYLEWKGVFYPTDLRREEFLTFYGEHFPTVELNFSYYVMPRSEQLASMVKRSGGGVDFSVKAHESLTHKVDPAQWKKRAAEYRRALEPLAVEGVLAAVLLQFPFSFHYNPDNRRYLDTLLKELSGLPLVTEFRNGEWFSSRVFDSLRKRNVGICSADLPPLRGLPPDLDVTTSLLGYIRFHGRNEKTWWGSDAAARFDYLYSREELYGKVHRIKGMAGQVKQLRIYFNNHRKGQAAVNALMLRNLLEQEGIMERIPGGPGPVPLPRPEPGTGPGGHSR